VITQAADPFPEFGARNPWPYARTQPGVILYYLRLAFWPDPIVMLYAWPYADTALRIVPPLLLLGMMGGVTLWGLWKRSWIGFLGAWFFLILAPSSSLAATEQVIQCQRMYLPLAAVLLLATAGAYFILVWFVRRAGGGTRLARVISIFALMLAAGALAWGTVRRNMAYEDELAFWQDNVARQPGSRAALSALGTELIIRSERSATDSKTKRELIEKAESCFRTALTVDDSPVPGDIHYYLGYLNLRSGRLDEALSHFRTASALRPYDAKAVERIGDTIAQQGLRLGDTPEAQKRFAEATQYLEQALSMQPDATVAANAHNCLGVVLARQGKLDEAAAHYRLATQFMPNWPQAFGNLGSTLVLLGRSDEALVPYWTALRMGPNNADIHNNLGSALLNLNRRDEAVGHFRKALQINPNHPMARKNLESALAPGESGQAPLPNTNLRETSSAEIPWP
jgi:tetratricopeptide (TPR) repeat protein